MRLPLVDGHGNFGSLDDGPAALAVHRGPDGAAPRCSWSRASTRTPSTSSPTTTTSCSSPRCCPPPTPTCSSTAPAGIAVGMATNMAPHNLVEVIGAARHLIANPDVLARRPHEVRPRPRPARRRQDRRARRHPRRLPHRPRQLPHPRDGARSSRSPRAAWASSSPSCPTSSAPRRSSRRSRTLVQAKKLQGIADVKDLTDRKHGLRLVIEVKNGFNPDAVLEQLYRLTPMEDSFGINNVALVDGQPRTLGLKDLLRGLRRLPHRRRAPPHRVPAAPSARSACTSSRACSSRSSTSTRSSRSSAAPTTPPRPRARLIDVFDLSEAQATYILDLQLRRLTKFSRIELENEKTELERADRGARGDPRRREAAARSRVRPSSPTSPRPTAPRAARCCWSRRGSARPRAAHAARGRRRPVLGAALLDRAARPHRDRRPVTGRGRPRSKHDVVVGAVRTTARGEVGLVTSRGPDGPAVGARAADAAADRTAPRACPAARRSRPTSTCPAGEEPLTIVLARRRRPPASPSAPRQGVVKRVTTDYPSRNDFEVIGLKDGDSVVGAAELRDRRRGPRLHHQRRPAAALPGASRCARRAARPAAWPASSSPPGQRVVFFGAVDPARRRRRRHLRPAPPAPCPAPSRARSR